jgi:hypothetical protein
MIISIGDYIKEEKKEFYMLFEKAVNIIKTNIY